MTNQKNLEEKLHALKLNECYADAIYYGDKTFEIRDNSDRGFQCGDTINLRVIDDAGSTIQHPLNHQIFEITYVLPYYGLKDNFVALAIKRVRE